MNLAMLLDMAAAGFGERVGFGPRDRGLTYQELRQRAGAGAALIREHGADCVVYRAETGPAFPVALFAASWAGVPLVPLNYRLGAEQLDAQLANHPGALEVDDWIAATAPGATSGADPGPWPDDPDTIALLLYTSGTTATPKAAVMRHRHLAAYVLGTVEFASASEDDAALVSVPPYHIAGVSNAVSNVYAGRRVVHLPDFSAEAWLDTARAEAITHALVVPTMLARIVEHLDRAGASGAGLPALRSLAYGGASMPAPVIERALELFPTTDFVNAYGLTETSSTIAVLGPDEHRAAAASDDPAVRARLGSAGRLVPGVEAEIRDGELWVRGEQVSGEYVGREPSLDAGGWFPTRDRAHFDPDGYLFLEGRADDTIIRGGENIAPAEIEDVLRRHPGVADVAVVGVPDEEWGQRIAAVVVRRHDAAVTAEELQAFAREHLRTSKTPDVVEFRPELPHTETGKLLRRALLADLVR
jgi:acyl-CoA synthetase (AMP-forming)/AMP-acid ligase II